MGSAIVVGAGPAGASLALVLAQRGIDVTLVERRRDFSREFRGEVLIPSGLDALKQMKLDHLLQRVPTQDQHHAGFYINGQRLFELPLTPDMLRGHLPLAVSQPAFLETLVSVGTALPNFTFLRGTGVRKLHSDAQRTTGVIVREGNAERALYADLIIGADGRNSMIRRALAASIKEASPPMDIVWCKLPRPQDWQGVQAFFGRGHLLLAYHTWDDSLQLGWVILKGSFGELRSRGVEDWVHRMAHHTSPELGAHLQRHQQQLTHPFLLDVESDCVDQWSAPGVLLIGDAAHTMSPVGGQGINVALRDAIVAANHLVPVLSAAQISPGAIDAAARRVQAERMPEITAIQRLQAQPPRLVLSQAWWGEPLRRLASALLRRPNLRTRLAPRAEPLLHGVTAVQLVV